MCKSRNNPVALTCLVLAILATSGADAPKAKDSALRLKADVYYLASGTLEGRGVTTPGIALAAAHIRAEFQRVGLKSGVPDGSFYQPFVHGKSSNGAGTRLNNVIGVIEGKGDLADETIVIGAHYDHLGHGQPETQTPRARVYAGADDNASGVAAMLELARRFSARKEPPRRRIVFIAFCAEESGRIGSQHYVANPPIVPIKQTLTMINFDMVGRLRGNELGIAGNESAKEFGELLARADDQSPLTLRLGGADYPDDSDHASFANAGVPILYVCTGGHDDRHTPADTADKINFDGLEQVVTFSQDVVERLLVAARPRFVPRPVRAR